LTFTPGEKRESVIGMFENIGRLSTRRLSKFAPDDSEAVSSSGVSARTMICSLIVPTSSVNGTLNCCPTPSTVLLRVVDLKPVI
jgi:hypothetical protein